MFINFFLDLRKHGIKTSLKEFLHLMEALDKQVIDPRLDEFYYLSRAALVKHEGQLDLYDILFGRYFRNMVGDDEVFDEIPEDWVRQQLERILTPEEMAEIEKMGGFEALMERFRKLMEEQDERHEGGDTWIGTLGTSPYGAYGYNPEGFRIGQNKSRHRKAIKVWDKREFANLNDKVELNTRNMKLALKRLRILTREGNPDELDLKKTIRKTSENAGYLDIHMVPSRKNRVKVLLLLDVGGSMDDHVELCSQLFSAARHEFKHLEYYYFHNCMYETVWKDNRRRTERISTWEILNKYNSDYKVIFIGDAAMSPFEITHRGGSVEHYNEEAGIEWLMRFKNQYPYIAWINPNPERHWAYYESTVMLRKWTDDRMFPMTLEGLGKAMKCLKDNKAKNS